MVRPKTPPDHEVVRGWSGKKSIFGSITLADEVIDWSCPTEKIEPVELAQTSLGESAQVQILTDVESAENALPESDAWKDEIQAMVLESKYPIPAARAFEQLKSNYPQLFDRFQEDRKSVQAEIPDTLRWIEENGVPILYNTNDPILRTVKASEAIAKLTLGSGNQTVATPAPPTDAVLTDDIRRPAADFKEVAERAAILREQANWSRQRTHLTAIGADFAEVIQPRDRELEQKSRENSIYLWMKRYEYSDEQWQQIADCFETLQKAAKLMQTMLDSHSVGKPQMEKIAQITADAICLLKTTILGLGLDFSIDHVQRDAYELAVSFAKTNGIYLNHLQRGDTIPFDERPQIEERIAVMSDQLHSQATAAKTMQRVEKKVQYHLNKIAKSLPGSEADWNKVVEGVTTLCEEYHVPTSAVSLRKYLIDFVDKIPDEIEITPTFGNVIQQIDFYVEQQTAFFQPEDKTVPKYTPAVKKVRKEYGDSKIVWVGGIPMEHLKRRIENRFNVEMLWEESDHGDSFSRFASVLNDPEVKLFLVYIPWCSHKHSEELAKIVKSAGKNFVRLPKGTNPDQIASTICRQTSG